MFKIQILNHIAANGLKQFPAEAYQLTADSNNPDAMLVRSHSMHDMVIPPSVQVIARAGAGVNNIPVAALTKRGVPVLNTPGANANAVRELVLAGMLMASRNICQAWDYVRQLHTSDSVSLENQIEQDKKQFVGFELLGKTLGVIGLGSIGVKVANAAMDLGMHVIGYDPTITINRAWELSSAVEQATSIEQVLKASDLVTLHVPLNDDTKNMINAARLGLIKKGAVLLNFARDGLVDKQALLTALNEKVISTYVCDFPCPLLKDHPHVISLPHTGASTHEAEENCAVMAAKQLRNFLEHGNITNAVNFPVIEMPHEPGNARLAIVNANVPNIVAQISTKLAAAGLNIIRLSNGSREDVAYTLIDVNDAIDDRLLNELVKIEGVIHARKVE
jgi:D-3-phosphoglycerate dehydrogenase / 2-oxoglutarate reductase